MYYLKLCLHSLNILFLKGLLSTFTCSLITIKKIFFKQSIFVGSAWSFVFSSPPQRPMISDFEGFLYQILSITLFSYLNSWERASTYFPFQCWVLNKGTTGTIFITSLEWRGPWLRIEPGTSRTRSQHSTIRLSRRRYHYTWIKLTL